VVYRREQVNDDENTRLLGELHGKLDVFLDRYHKDREETTKRYEAERVERKEWRDGIDSKIKGVEEKIAPVVRDHQFIVRGGTWIASTAMGGFGLIKGWLFLKDHLK
jgi:hypothetical protein